MSAAPSSQKGLPVGFMLTGRAGVPDTILHLTIRPEDLTRTEPSRMSVHQTLSGNGGTEPTGWADSFGPGLKTINISGTTGWRPGAIDAKDGAQRFLDLYAVFQHWHQYRALNIADGLDPDRIQLVFVDNLDQFAYVVAPTGFNLRRSRSRPLLFQYQIGMEVLNQNVGDLSAFNAAPTAANQQQLGLDSLATSISKIGTLAGQIVNFVNTQVLAPLQGFLATTQRVLSAVQSVYTSINSVTVSLINVARTIAQAGRNIFQSLALVANLGTFVKSQLMAVAAEFNNVFCLLHNALKVPAYYNDYSALYGSSNCSSTNGGLPPSLLANQNPFFVVSPVTPAATLVQPVASSSLRLLSQTDPVLSPLSSGDIALHAGNVASGVSVPSF